ncbi:MAG: tetratricopeptide repeat protein [Methanomicrobiales archaeon]
MTPKDPDLPTGDDDTSSLAGTPGKTRSRPEGSHPWEAPGATPGAPETGHSDTACSEPALYARVSSLLEEGRLREAEHLLTRGLEIYPESVDLLKEFGVLYHLQGRFGKAARTFTRVMNITGEGRQSLSWRIASLHHQALDELGGADPGLSLPTFGRILALDPSNREARAGQIAALRLLGRLGEAGRYLQEGLSLDPPGASILYQEGWLCMDLDRPDLASGAFEKAAIADPAWPEPVLSKALAMERLGRGTEAGKMLRRFVESQGGAPHLRADLGWFLLSIRDLKGAREIFLELADREDDLQGFHGLAALMLAAGRMGDARGIMERLAGARPRDPLILVNTGMVLARSGKARDLADAAIAVKRALSLFPACGPALSCLGIIASRQGKPDEAQAHFAGAVRQSDPAGYRNLGLLACARGRWGQAEPLLTRATGLDPLDARAWAGLGAIALQAGRAGEALSHLRRAALLDPRDSAIARGLAIALARSGDPAGSEEVIRRALGLTSGPERWVLLLELAALLVSRQGPNGDPVLAEEAVQLLAKAGQLRPDEPGILFYLGAAKARLGNLKEALELFASSMRGDRYRVPAQENGRRLKRYLSSRGRFPHGLPVRVALAALFLLQLAGLWFLFAARLLSEAGFVFLIAILSGLLAVASLLPARNGGRMKEAPPELVLPERNFVPFPEADMVSPLIRLRTALRPRTDSRMEQ